MNLLRSAAMAFSTFSRIPMPHFQWEQENMKWMLCFFPLVGVVIGACLVLWFFLGRWLGFSPLLMGAGLTFIPILVTGGIHLDGFCDVSDALASHAEPQRKREILKDSHVGAFAVIGLAVCLILYLVFATEVDLDLRTILLIAIMHVSSRCAAGFASIALPKAFDKGMLASQTQSADAKRSLVILFVSLLVCLACQLLICFWPALVMACCADLTFLYLWIMSKRQFEGMNGDQAGYFLQLAELVMLIALVLTQKVMVLL